MSKPRILVARAIFPDIVNACASADVEASPDDVIWTQQELAARLADKDGVLTTNSQRVDAALLAAAPLPKSAPTWPLGYNNFDVDRHDAAGVQGHQYADIFTDTTADFGFAFLMATARRMTEASITCAPNGCSGDDMFAGSDIHGKHAGHHRHGAHQTGHYKRGAHGFGMG